MKKYYIIIIDSKISVDYEFENVKLKKLSIYSENITQISV